MITLDSSALIALINADDQYHDAISQAFLGEQAPYIIPVPILSETTYVLE